ncbi:helix-turn-helix domain-containing protein [Rhodococcoides fascians]|uniref:helix-turn-helix domain-containing protein n=1 Tax=Rhodococcoides fascians TaxID=1828 RepID=UPI0009B85111
MGSFLHMTISVDREAAENPEFDFSDCLRKVRRSVAQMTQAEMAAELGVSRARYEAWESGRNTPDNIVAVAKRIEMRWRGRVTAAWMLGVNERSPRPDGDPNGGSALPRLDSNQQPSD